MEIIDIKKLKCIDRQLALKDEVYSDNGDPVIVAVYQDEGQGVIYQVDEKLGRSRCIEEGNTPGTWNYD